MKTTNLVVRTLFVAVIIFFLLACGSKKEEGTNTETSAKPTTQEVTPAKEKDRLISYCKEAVAWSESDEFLNNIKGKDPMGMFSKLAEIAKGVGYDGEDFNAISKQIEKDYKAFKDDPEVEEWHNKFQAAFK
jgi:hypothetical protein